MLDDLHFIVPKVPVAAVTVVATSAGISNVVGRGSVIAAAVVIVLAGGFTLRNNLKSFWKELAEERGEQVKSLEAQLAAKAQALVDAQLQYTEQMASFAEEQREVRHQLKADLAAVRAQLTVEKGKHDLSSLVARMDALEQTLDGRTPFFEQIAGSLAEHSLLLEAIRDRIAARQEDG